MNDKNNCVYSYVNACHNHTCDKCSLYTPPSDRKYKTLKRAYDEDIEEAIEPINEKWREWFVEGVIT